jgi:YhcH/YjgK/YiaL family protein
MIYGTLDDFEAMGLGSLGEAVSRSVAWIRNLPIDPKEGRYALEGDGMYALVMRYATGDAAASRFETHRQYVDLQYTLAGAEVIDWAPRGTLTKDGDYDAEKDLLFHHPGPAFGRVIKAAGCFSIFTPVDAHRPKIRTEGFESVFKLVVKIPVDLFAAP